MGDLFQFFVDVLYGALMGGIIGGALCTVIRLSSCVTIRKEK